MLFEKLKSLAREPLVHFLLIGAGIYALYGVLASGDEADNERIVTVSAGDIQSLADQWTRLWNRPPTEEELAQLVGVLVHRLHLVLLVRAAVGAT